MSNNGILYLNIGFDCHNYSNWVNIDHNSIAVSGRMALPRLGKQRGLCELRQASHW
jgi:hypothetical protein